MSTRHRHLIAGALTLVVIVLTVGCGGDQSSTVDPSTVAAQVNGVEIRAGAVEKQYAVALATVKGAQVVTADEEGRTAMRAQMLGGLIQLTLLEQAAAERGIEVAQADLDAQRAALTAMGGGEAAYAERVKGIPAEEVDRQLRQAVLEDKLMAALAAEVVVPRADIVAFYDTNLDTRFGPRVTSRHILVADRAGATAVLDRLRRGEEFAAVAADVSLDAGTAQTGGRLGAIQRGTTFSAVEDALFSAAPGDVVGPVRTRLGFEILEVLRREEARPYAAVRDEIRSELAMARGRQQLVELIAREAATAKVEVNHAFGRWEPEQGIVLPAGAGA